MTARPRMRLAVIAAVITAGVAGASGCVHIENTPPEPTPTTPLVIDEAMQARVWDRTSSYYENGGTLAGGVGYEYRPKPGQPLPLYAVEDAALFVGQTVAFPITVWFSRPWEERVWKGETVEPTYTAQVPLPEEPAAAPSQNPNEPPGAEGQRPSTESTLPGPATTTSPASQPQSAPGTSIEQMPQAPATAPAGPVRP